ncbi:MAG TPA: patatin-like phospholipase family protein [Thermoanaerobaculia bacterium]|nr:patatin-like phospholipase family protein [Thermoanaerobaculia bacterium]
MEESPTPATGRPGRRCRALAFAGGGFDTATQLGVAHALLVARGVAPDYVAGISAGAVNAAALAEILQAGDDLPADERREAQVVTLRRFLASYEELPAELLRSIFPDTFEINAAKPLKPVELPIHFDRERQGRDTANQARAGLIRLLNRLCEVRLPVQAIALIANRVLHFVAATEEVSWGRRLWTRAWTLGSLWGTGFRYADGLGPTAGALAWAALAGAPRETTGFEQGRKAASLIGGRRTFRQALRGVRDLLDVVLFVLSWIVLPLFAVPALAWTYLRSARRRRSTLWRRLGDRILQHYGLADGLGNSYVIKEQLIRCFDPGYYGAPDIGRVLDQALGRAKTPAPAEKPRKTLGRYPSREPRIVVAPIAADLASGDLRVLPRDVSVVDALLAATAIVPLFPAVKVESRCFKADGASEKIFVDGLNISNEPIGALLELLRQEDDPHQAVAEASGIDVYTVSGSAEAATQGECSRLLQVALRAFQLRRRRDATMEQRYADLYTRALPVTGKARITIGEKTYVRAAVWPIRLDRPAAINREVLTGNADVGLQGLIEEAVADGCRATLEAMIPRAIATAARPADSVPCWQAVRRRLGEAEDGLLGDRHQDGPGLPEICARCALHREPLPPEPPSAPAADRSFRQRLRLQAEPQGPEWPLQGEAVEPGGPPLGAPAVEPPTLTVTGWPLDRAALAGRERPVVSFLFGGGVFRGVFHMGVMNGLNELGLMPDLVAGSSVGSIVAAMIAQVFAGPRSGRQGPIADLAATFLGLDQLVMTDRLADFVRGLTLRAADADFSARDFDLALRRYDLDPRAYGARARRVVAGLERLFYLSPTQLFALVRAAREQDYRTLSELLQAAFQELLDRGGVGREILGAEPLALLIHQEVIQPLHPGASDETFAAFARHGIQFLATATNLLSGELEVLGLPEDQDQTSLLYGLLASSAFPVVFRPRRRWEILRRDKGTDLFVDGGIIDNLPLDAAARFLDQASRGAHPTVARRPRVGGREVPHLLFTASLEVDKTALGDGGAEEVRKNFLRLKKRAKTFGYNRKIDAYQTLQRDLREIYQSRVRQGEDPAWTPLDLHVLAVRPRWLCNTFSFHPMLRFRRQKQVESIAHGCASTIATFYHDARQNGTRAWMEAWGVHGLDVVDAQTVTSHFDPSRPALNPRREGKERGLCWFRDAPCPFSRESLAAHPDLRGRAVLLEELPKIHQACGRPETHRPAHAVQNAVE